MTQQNNRTAPSPGGGMPKSPLVALVGAGAAIALATMIPKDESGRKVEASVTNDGALLVEHKRGPQYLTAYADIVGVWTICDGDTKGVRSGMVETEAGCRDRLERQLIAHARPVLNCVPSLRAPDREHQLVASVSLAYNIGTGGFCRSTVARRFNAGDWRGGCDAMLMWNKAGGREVRGLTLRRQRERAICLRGL
jgi:lysozyme